VASFQKRVFRDFEATTNGKAERRVKQILVPEAMHAWSLDHISNPILQRNKVAVSNSLI